VSIKTEPANREQLRHSDLLTVPETARRLRRSSDSLYRLVRAGKFDPAIKVGGRWLISVPKLDRMLHGDDAT
jgi:excisionase family DNA binding protein